MPEPFPDPRLTVLESALAGLAPSAGGVSRDRVLFEAGRAAARPGRLWPAAASLSSLAALALGWLLLTRPPEVVVQRVVRVEVKEVPAPSLPSPKPPAPPAPERGPYPAEALAFSRIPGGDGYLRRRWEILRWGADALPAAAPQPSSGQVLTPGALLERSDDSSDPTDAIFPW